MTVGSRFRKRFIVCAVACAVASPTPPAMTTVRSPSPRLNPAVPRNCAKPRDETDRRGRAERGPVVLVHLVAQAGVADVVQAHELIEAIGAAVRQDEPVEATASRVSPNVWTGFVSPSTREPAGIST